MNPALPGNSLPGQNLHATATAVLAVPPSPPFIVPITLPDAIPGTSYSQALSAAGGQPPYAWSISSTGGLPGGLTLDSATGVITGMPTGSAYGRINFVVSIIDTLGVSASVMLSIFVQWAGTPLSVVAAAPAIGAVGSAYTQSIQAAGGLLPYSWSVFGALPPGLSMSSDGVISGTPVAFGIYPFTVQVADATGVYTAQQPLSITVQPVLVVDTVRLPMASIGQPYLATLSASGGTPPYYWLVLAGALPAGLSLDTNTGIISGTPTALTSNPITFEVIDSA